MKSIVLSSIVASLLVFSGCSDKSPVVDEMAQVPAQEVKAVETETVASENSVVNGSGGNGSVSSSTNDSTANTSSNESTINSSSKSNNNSNAMISQEVSISQLESQLTSVYFDFDRFAITSAMQDKISNDAIIAKSTASAYSVKLEGNCDEWGSDEYNFALGLKRANSVKKALVSEGVDASRITMVSYGESNPVCSDKTQECWSKNRRVDFSLLP